MSMSVVVEVVFTLLCSNDCNDKHGTKPAPTPRLRAFTATQQHRSLLEMGQSVVPAEEQDSSNFVQQKQLSRDLSDPTQPPLSNDQFKVETLHCQIQIHFLRFNNTHLNKTYHQFQKNFHPQAICNNGMLKILQSCIVLSDMLCVNQFTL